MLTAHNQGIDPKAPADTLCPLLSRSLENTTILQKGATDIISNGLAIPASLLPSDMQTDGVVDILKSEVKGGLKRCGGQGDILSGSVGVLLAWAGEWVKGVYEYVSTLLCNSRANFHPGMPDIHHQAKNPTSANILPSSQRTAARHSTVHARDGHSRKRAEACRRRI